MQGETISVCTIEKANVALNRIVSDGRLGEIAAVVFDELHLVGESHRYTLSIELVIL